MIVTPPTDTLPRGGSPVIPYTCLPVKGIVTASVIGPRVRFRFRP